MLQAVKQQYNTPNSISKSSQFLCSLLPHSSIIFCVIFVCLSHCFFSCIGCKPTTRVVVCWLFLIPAPCQCISRTDLLRKSYVLPHWGRSCRPDFLSHPQSTDTDPPDNARVATEVSVLKYDSTWKKDSQSKVGTEPSRRAQFPLKHCF